MKLPWLLALVTISALPAAASGGARPDIVSRYGKLTSCKVVAEGDVDRGEDWGLLRCNGVAGMSAWYRCQDSARCKLGFGTRPNASVVFEARSFLSWPVEWRGTVQQGRFKPFAAVVRGRWAGAEGPATTLFVYRIRPDGTSCIVGEASRNEVARRISDKAANDYRCTSEPELLR
jgi:hypothetical protein